MLTLNAVHETALAMERAGNEPSFKLALWAGALSANNRLTWECQQVPTLRPYVLKPLPASIAEVRAIVRSGNPFCGDAQARYLLNIQARMDSAGAFSDMPTNWVDWRHGMRKLFKGAGLSYKTLSFVGLLMWPTSCDLVPVDRHVCARFDVPESWGSSSYKRYADVENMVRQEWVNAGSPYSLGEWHWFKWEQWRQAHNDAPKSDVPESHMGLNPRVY